MQNVYSTAGPMPRPMSRFALVLRRVQRSMRRVTDIGVSLVGLICLAPIFAVIAWLIKRDSPGPVFYRGRRIGLCERRFWIIKFRTMYECPESYAGMPVTADGDKRVTPFGQWLRRTKVNELPQLWNVLVGDMSLVGPRPEDPEMAMLLPAAVREEILSVRPGVTSPASIMFRDEETMLKGADWMEEYLGEILPSKLRLDLLYIRNRNFFTDLDVLFWTAITLLPRVRKFEIPNHLLYWGPVSRLFSRYLSWFLIDCIVAGLATWASEFLWRLYQPLEIGVASAFWLAFAFAFIFSLINYALGLHRIEWSKAAPRNAVDVVASAAIGTILILLFDRQVFPPASVPGRVVVTTGILAAMGFLTVRYRERLITGVATRWLDLRRGVNGVGERVLIVGAGDMGEFATFLFTRSKFVGVFTIAGFLDDDPRKVGLIVNGSPILGTTENLIRLVEKHDIGVIVYAITEIDSDQRERIISLARQTSAKLILLPDIMEILRQGLAPRPVEDLQEMNVSIG
jgi:lipopolysaccharide/colanic/teichoic acid biosynthesis glycosyltransferase